MTNHNTDWKTMVNVTDGPQAMHYRGDFCGGTYATVIVDNYGTTQGNAPDEHIQAGELVTVEYDQSVDNINMQSVLAAYPPYQVGTDDDLLTSRPTRTPNNAVSTVVPKVKYMQHHPTTGNPNLVGVVLVDPFPVDPQNIQGHGPGGNDVWITHIALQGFCLAKDKRVLTNTNVSSRYVPGRLVGVDAQSQQFGAPTLKNYGTAVYCMTNILDANRQSTSFAEAIIGTFHRVVAWGGTDRTLGHRAGFAGGTAAYSGQDILLIHLSGMSDTGYAL